MREVSDPKMSDMHDVRFFHTNADEYTAKVRDHYTAIYVSTVCSELIQSNSYVSVNAILLATCERK